MASWATATICESVVARVGKTMTTMPVTMREKPIKTPTKAKGRFFFSKKETLATCSSNFFMGTLRTKAKIPPTKREFIDPKTTSKRP